MSIVLKKDIVIPAGTVFHTASTKTQRFGNSHYEHVIGLTDDSCGFLNYDVDPDDPALGEWFEEVPEEVRSYQHES